MKIIQSLVLVTLGCCTGAQAVTTQVDLPPFWTSTYNRAQGSATAYNSGDGGFSQMKVYVEGNVVKSTNYSAPYPRMVAFDMVFDSTHFSSGILADVKIEVTDVSSGTFSTTSQVQIKNNAATYILPEFTSVPGGNPISDIIAKLTACNWMASAYSSGWTSSSLLTNLADEGVHYVDSHGGPNYHRDTADADVYGDPDYLAERTTLNGTGIPPYSSTHRTQMSFTFFDSCESGRFASGTKHLKAILFPYTIYDFSETHNQAAYTWEDYALSGEAEYHCGLLFADLKSGMTIKQARAQIILDNATSHKLHKQIASVDYLVDNVADLPIWGDENTKIHTIYTGASGPVTTAWYRDRGAL